MRTGDNGGFKVDGNAVIPREYKHRRDVPTMACCVVVAQITSVRDDLIHLPWRRRCIRLEFQSRNRPTQKHNGVGSAATLKWQFKLEY